MGTDILEKLRSADPDAQREGALEAAEAREEAAVPLLVSLLAHPNLGVQDAADYALRKIGGRAAVEGLLPLLRSEFPPLRNLGMDLLRALGKTHLPLLVQLLKDTDPDVRIFMADILGSTRTIQAVGPLCDAMLHDAEVNVRYQAAISLGALGWPEAIPSLHQALDDEEWVQFAVVEALMKIRDESSVTALLRALDHSSELVCSIIIDALGELADFKAAPLLMQRLDAASAALRNKILRALVRIMGSKSLGLLAPGERQKFGDYFLAALDDDDPEIQDAAISGLEFTGDARATGRILALAEHLDPDQDLERLRPMIQTLAAIGLNAALEPRGKNEQIRVVLMALEAIGTPEAAALIMSAFASLDRDMQRTASSILASIGTEASRDFFLRVLAESKDGTVLKQALFFLGQTLRCANCAEPILEFLDHRWNDVKEAALDAAVAIGNSTVIARFMDMTADENDLRRLMGVYGLGRLGPRTYRDALMAALHDSSPDVRKISLEALGQIPDKPEVTAALLGLAHDPVPEVRQALVETLGPILSDSVQAFLQAALHDEDDWVRIRAVDALARQHNTAIVPSLIALLEDENRMVVMKTVAALGCIGGQAALKALLSMLNADDPEMQDAAQLALEQLQAGLGKEN